MICPVCDETRFASQGAVQRCQGCGCMALPDPGRSAPAASEESPIYMQALRSRGFRGGALLTVSKDPAGFAPGAYDAALLLNQLQTHPAPGELLASIHHALRPESPLLVTLPRLDPHNGDRWLFDATTIQLLLLRQGFHQILVHKLNARELLVTAAREKPRARPKCSIIVAAFNESRTFPVLMDALLKKELANADREIIVVESNSTDGTRELAEQYRHCPGIKLVLQDSPRGKGDAVREGFRHATGDIVLIQDADLEYDLDDYDSLLAPILFHRALFVLGTRHAGHWKIRQFAKQKILSASLNLGHRFFTGLINVLFRQEMTDPFTMFKVFRRDCLFGLESVRF
jgi:hypothetical protein